MSLFLSIFTDDILPIFVLAGVGFALARLVGASVKTLSAVSFHALSPCLIFEQLAASQVGFSESWRVAAFCVAITAAIGGAAYGAALVLRLAPTTRTTFLLVSMFSNSGNYALPVVLFAFGQQALAYASVYFVVSAVLVYSVGVVIAASGRRDLQQAVTGIVRVPAVWAVAASLLVLALDVEVPASVMRPISLLSSAAIPVMLLVLGAQIERHTAPEQPRAVAVAVALSLLVAPILAFVLADVLHLEGPARQAAIIEASMPAAVVTTVLALEFELDANFATSVVVFTTMLSPFTLIALIAYLKAT